MISKKLVVVVTTLLCSAYALADTKEHQKAIMKLQSAKKEMATAQAAAQAALAKAQELAHKAKEDLLAAQDTVAAADEGQMALNKASKDAA